MHIVERYSQRKSRVAICITTFRRPEMLRQLLLGISRLTFDRMPEPDILVVVVDNDESQSAAEICNSVFFRWPAKYVVESRRGIAQARNRAIQEAENPEFTAFIDDDEVPTPRWLDELLWARACFDCGVVCGTVLPRYIGDAPQWVKSGGFFSKHVYMTGQLLEMCGTGNVLISRKVIDAMGSFDERFALTGGEDTHFFLRARRAGFQIVCSAGAIVYEAVPLSRANLRWLLRRAYQVGNCWVLCESSLDRSTFTHVARVFKAGGRIAQGATSACLCLVLGKAALAQALSNLFLGAGMIAALAGRNFQGYRISGADTTT